MSSKTEFEAIAQLDLDPIKVKLMHAESGEGWTLEYANAVEFEYRRFLCLMKLFPNEETAPLFDVDIFWHYHILDTMKYAADCDSVFGYFLHHFPYIGLRGKDDLAAHQRVGERMRELYEATFGESYVRGPQDDATANAGTNDKATAFSGATAKAAFSGATTKAAFSGATTKAAFSGATTKAAFSGATTKAAFSGATTKAAFSGATTKAAFSGATTKAAFSGATVKAAFSGATVKAAFSGATAKNDANMAVEPSRFYSTRPVLAAA